MLSSKIFPVGLPLSRGASNRVRSTSRGGRSPSAPKPGAVPNGAIGSGANVSGATGAPGRGRRSRSVTKVGIKLGAYRVTLRRRSVSVRDYCRF